MLSRMWYDWDIFDNLMHETFRAVPVKATRSDNGIGYEFDMPGVAPEDIEANIENGVLTISGKREGRTVFGSITLPRNVNSDSLEARYENGVLQIVAPYAESAKPRRIEISSPENHKELN